MRTILPLAMVSLAFLPWPGGAQVVRGVVKERASGAAIAGVVVSLERADSANSALTPQVALSVLTNEQGEYALRATSPGQYYVTAKRVGVRRFTSEPFALGSGETHRVDIDLDALLYSLPEVVVNVNALCAARRTSMQRLAALWDEARTALTATQISVRDSLYRTNVTRYVLMMDPTNLKVLSESRVHIEGVTAKPFASISSDSLSKVGFWRELRGDSVEFFGPDAEVLLSDAFRQEHCFSVVEGNRDRRGLVGLTFEPVMNRELPDIRGTLWMDGRTFELRFIEFAYTRLPVVDVSRVVGGEVHFALAPSGAWIVSQWRVRIPQFARYALGTKPLPQMLVDAFNAAPPAVLRLMEEGAMVEAGGLRGSGRTASISGVLLDTLGRPVRDASVHLAGQWLGSDVDADGHFRIDSLAAGTYSVLAESRGYSALGTSATSAFVTLPEGAAVAVTLRSMRAREIIPKLCNGLPPVPPRATLRLVMLDSATQSLITGMPLIASWVENDPDVGGTRARTLTATTDLSGAVAFCGLPPEVPIELSIARENQDPVPVSVFGLRKNQVIARMIKLTPSR
jgi:carboxypeptidase family protein